MHLELLVVCLQTCIDKDMNYYIYDVALVWVEEQMFTSVLTSLWKCSMEKANEQGRGIWNLEWLQSKTDS